MMGIHMITSTEGFLNLKDDWERLEQQDEELTYYSTFHFNYTWWLTFGQCPQKQLFILCKYHQKEIVAIAPLMLERTQHRLMTYTVLKFLGTGDHLNFIMNRSQAKEMIVMKEIFAEIERNSTKWDQLVLTNLAEGTSLLQYLLRSNKFNRFTNYATQSPQIDLAAFESYEDFIRQCLPAEVTQDTNKLQQEVGYEFHIIHPQEDDNAGDRIFSLHEVERARAKSAKGSLGHSSLLDFDQPFLKKLFPAKQHVITFLMQTKEQEMISYCTCFVFNRKLHCWSTGVNAKYDSYRVTNIRIAEMMKYLFEHDMRYICDWGAGGDSWKFEWTRQYSSSFHFSMWNLESRISKSRGAFRLVRGILGK